MFPTWTLARSRLARAVQDGAPAERIAELRHQYHIARAACNLGDLIAAHQPTPDERRALADLLAEGGGDRDGA